MRSRPDGTLFLDVVTAGFGCNRPVAWLGNKLLVPDPLVDSVRDPAELVHAAECCDADGDVDEERAHLARLEQYGRLLFEAAFGHDNWEKILAAVTAAGADYLEVAIRGAADDAYATLQALRWEALHDGETGFIVAQGTAYAGRSIAVGVVRLITAVSPGAGNAAPGDAAFQEITHIPKVLFAVGSHLTDQNVRPGAEFMGIMRRLDRRGGSIRGHLLQRATRRTLVAALQAFKPDVLHLIGHGERRSAGQVEIQIRHEPDGEDWLSADQLLNIFAEAKHWPTMAVLSVCQTASPDRAAGSAPGAFPVRVSAQPFAAQLVAGSAVARGVPVAVAMAGDISDTACRVFTQALTNAIGDGAQLGKAVTLGRGAAFYGRPGPVSGHWVMPTLFLACHVPKGARLVNPARMIAARKRVEDLGMVVEPVFCGRAEFITALDELLNGDDLLNVLVAYTSDQYQSFGGTRLLQELGARAVRDGVLPVLLDVEGAPPMNLVELAQAFRKCIDRMRLDLGLRKRSSRAVAAATSQKDLLKLGQAIRRDLDYLVQDLPEDDPVRHRASGQPRTILLFRRVDEWIEVLDDLIELLGPHGLGAGTARVPVVLTGADVHQLRSAREGKLSGPAWIRFLPLDRFSKDKDKRGDEVDPSIKDEDILAYTWWLLNPPPNERVYAPSRGASDGWRDLLRLHVEDAPLYPERKLYMWARVARDYFTSENDDALLASYAKAMR
jgi:CHAT domain